MKRKQVGRDRKSQVQRVQYIDFLYTQIAAVRQMADAAVIAGLLTLNTMVVVIIMVLIIRHLHYSHASLMA